MFMYYKTTTHKKCKTEQYNREGETERRTQRRGKGRDGKVCSFHRNKLKKKQVESWIRPETVTGRYRERYCTHIQYH